MLLRASLGMAVVLASMGLVTNVYQLVGLRLLQGSFLAISVTPQLWSPQEHRKSVAAKSLVPRHRLGHRSTARAFGGRHHRQRFWLSFDLLHYRKYLVLVFLLSLIFVHEEFTPIKTDAAG